MVIHLLTKLQRAWLRSIKELHRFAWPACRSGLTLLILASVLAVGGVHTKTLLILACVTGLVGICAALVRGTRWPAAASIPLALSGFTLLQSLPMPAGWLQILAPANADTWARALDPALLASPQQVSISLDPGASLRETLKWLCYAIVVFSAFTVASRQRAHYVFRTVFMAALVVAVVGIIHQATGADRLYGVYEPRDVPDEWPRAPLLNPNNFSGYMNLGAFCGVATLIAQKRHRIQLFTAVGITLLMATSLMTGSRGGLLSLLFGYAALIVTVYLRKGAPTFSGDNRHPMRRWLVPTGLGTVGLVLLGINAAVVAELRQETLEKLRLGTWGWNMLQDHPWFGVGRGAFETTFPAYRENTGHAIYSHAENVAVQWATEWGAPIAILATLAFASVLGKRMERHRLGPSRQAALIGLCVLMLQNLADLSLEVPGVAFAAFAVFGAIVSQDARGAAPASGRSRRPRRALRAVPAFAIFLLVGPTALNAATTAATLRQTLGSRVASSDLSNAAQRSELRSKVHEAIRRHPADPFFPTLAATIAKHDPQGRPLAWLGRAIERDPMNSRPHLLLADELARRGALHQAILELRFAIEREPSLRVQVATRAIRWTDGNRESLDRLLAPMPDLPRLLLELARRLPGKETELREAWIDKALKADRTLTEAHELAALTLLRGQNGCDEACLDKAKVHADTIRRLQSDATSGITLTARVLTAQGRINEARQLLSQSCFNASSPSPCLMAWVQLELGTGSPASSRPAINAYLASACTLEARCAQAERWVAGQLAQRGHHLGALTHLGRAANLEPSGQAWVQVAEQALRLGNSRQAQHALRKAEALSLNDPSLQRRVHGLRRRMLREGFPSTSP